MYQKFWRLAALLLVGVTFSACTTEPEDSLCGNGVLDTEESCDADNFAEWINVDCDASKDLYFQRSLLKCTNTCELDITTACRSGRCGNGILEEGEDCDGRIFPELEFACENPKLSNLICTACQIVDRGVCDVIKVPVCGDEELDASEKCDGRIFKDGVRVCPSGSELVDPLSFKCHLDCKGIDTTSACKAIVDPLLLCGNDVIDEGVGETCDGDAFLESAVAGIVCPGKSTFDRSQLICKDCKIDSKFACVPETRVLISEVVPYLREIGGKFDLDAVAFEITNEMTKDFDINNCNLTALDSGGIAGTIALSSLGLSKIKPGKSIVICDQKSIERYNGRCTASVEKEKLLNFSLEDGLLALTCKDIGYVDIFNLNSFRAAISNGGVVFTRLCGAIPVIEPMNALLGVGWSIGSSTSLAPTYGLGSHCQNIDLSVESCTYTASRTALNDRSQSTELELLLKIKGLTDKSSKNDSLQGITINFTTGQIGSNGKISSQVHHMVVNPISDSQWVNSEGIDRYTGTLRNWDSFEGFFDSESGQYTLDAAISFDQGKSYVYCGPKGVIQNYETLDITTRNMLKVSYDDNGGVCHNGVLSSSEVCDGKTYRPETLYCADPFTGEEDPNVVVAYPENLKCSCNMVSTTSACAMRSESCGNDKLDASEVCDEEFIDHAKVAAKCPKGTVYYPARTQCRLNCEANAFGSCIPPSHLLFNEFLVHYNDKKEADGMALSIFLTSEDPIDANVCSLSILDENGKALAYISVADLLPASNTDKTIKTCKAIRVCSEPSVSTQFFSTCDILLSGNPLIKLLPKTEIFQLSCGGQIIDTFDAEGLRYAMQQHVSHGIAKESLPWPSAYVDLNQRMTLTNDVDISTIDFGKDCGIIE